MEKKTRITWTWGARFFYCSTHLASQLYLIDWLAGWLRYGNGAQVQARAWRPHKNSWWSSSSTFFSSSSSCIKLKLWETNKRKKNSQETHLQLVSWLGASQLKVMGMKKVVKQRCKRAKQCFSGLSCCCCCVRWKSFSLHWHSHKLEGAAPTTTTTAEETALLRTAASWL